MRLEFCCSFQLWCFNLLVSDQRPYAMVPPAKFSVWLSGALLNLTSAMKYPLASTGVSASQLCLQRSQSLLRNLYFFFESCQSFTNSIELFVLQRESNMQPDDASHHCIWKTASITKNIASTCHFASKLMSNSLTYFTQIIVRKEASNHGLANGQPDTRVPAASTPVTLLSSHYLSVTTCQPR